MYFLRTDIVNHEIFATVYQSAHLCVISYTAIHHIVSGMKGPWTFIRCEYFKVDIYTVITCILVYMDGTSGLWFYISIELSGIATAIGCQNM